MTQDQIAKLTDPCERLYQKAHNALHGKATITASVTIQGGGNVVRTTMYRVIANGPDVIEPVAVEHTTEWQLLRDLEGAWRTARRTKDMDVFKREVQQRSGKAVTPEQAQAWADQLKPLPYPQYIATRAKFMSQAVASHPANK